MAKTDKLLKMRAAYQGRVEEAAAAAADAAVAGEDEDEGEEGEEGDEDAAESVYAARMAAGAYTLQLLDMATAYLVSAKQKALRQKTLRTLYDTGHALHDVWAGVQAGCQPSPPNPGPWPMHLHLDPILTPALILALTPALSRPVTLAQECVAARDKDRLDAATTRSTANMMAAVEQLLAKYRPAPAPQEEAEGGSAADAEAPADE